MRRRAAAQIDQALERLPSLTLDELHREWAQLYRTTAPRISRDLLILGLAFRLQERAYGGLSRAAERKLETMVASVRAGDQLEITPKLTLKPGARLVREWHGRMHVVTVLQDGYEHDGTVFASLSSIATKITGVHHSGPRFFGLPRPSAKRVART